jgi:hypothetical protein
MSSSHAALQNEKAILFEDAGTFKRGAGLCSVKFAKPVSAGFFEIVGEKQL